MTIPIPVALVYGDNENESIERSTCVWIFRNPNDFYQCVYADSWREAETLIFGKKNNKNSWPEKFRSNLLLDFPRKKRKEDSSILSTPSTITVAACALNFASQASVVFIAPGMSEKYNNHKNDCTLRKLFQSAGLRLPEHPPLLPREQLIEYSFRALWQNLKFRVSWEYQRKSSYNPRSRLWPKNTPKRSQKR